MIVTGDQQVGEAGLAAPSSPAPAACRATGRRTSRRSTRRAAGRRCSRRSGPQPEDAEGHERRLGAQLDDDEGRDQRRRGGERARSSPPTPSPRCRCLTSAYTSSARPAVDRDGAGEVEVAGRALGAALVERSAAPSRGRPAPIGTLTKKIHSQPSVSVRTPPASTPAAPPTPAMAPQIAERLVALGALVEGRDQDREGRRGDDRGADALHGAGDDQEAVAGREAAGQRGQREDDAGPP